MGAVASAAFSARVTARVTAPVTPSGTPSLTPSVTGPAPATPWALASVVPLVGLRPAEARGVEAGSWFAGLSPGLRQAILARSRVQRVPRGATLLRRGSVATDWLGVAGGALGLGTRGRDGRTFTLDLLGPGDWYGDIALIDDSPVDLDVVAQAASTVLLVDRRDLQQLMLAQPELRAALLMLDCRRLRHMFRRLEEVQTLALSARVALQLQRLLRQFGLPDGADGAGARPAAVAAIAPLAALAARPGAAPPGRAQHGPQNGAPPPTPQQIGLSLTQGDLASLLGASRQRINHALRQMQALGILGAVHGTIEVRQPGRLADVAQGRLVLDRQGAQHRG